MKKIDLPELTRLAAEIAAVIKSKLTVACHISNSVDRIIVSVSLADMEERLGLLLQQIHRAVDLHFPERKYQLSLVIRDHTGLHTNRFKIWPTVV